MNIFGKKVIIRAIEKEDLQILKKAINSPELENNEATINFPISDYQQEKWYESINNNNNSYKFIIQYEDRVVGYTNILNIDWINRSAWTGIKIFSIEDRGKGIGTDSVMAVMKFAFEYLNLQRLEGAINEYNKSSYNLYIKKCGWKQEGTKRKAVFKKGKYYNIYTVSILKEEYDQLINENNYWDK